MKRKLMTTLTVDLTLLALAALPLGAKDPDWKTGKVLDAAAAKSYVEAGDRTGATVTLTIRDTQLLLVSDEFAYVVNDTRTSNRLPLHQGVIGDSSHRSCRFRTPPRMPLHRGR